MSGHSDPAGHTVQRVACAALYVPGGHATGDWVGSSHAWPALQSVQVATLTKEYCPAVHGTGLTLLAGQRYPAGHWEQEVARPRE